MRTLLLLMVLTFGLAFTSCNSNKPLDNSEEQQSKDSIKSADSIIETKNAMKERMQYRTYIKHELDSMEKALNKADSFYTAKKMDGRLEWKNEKSNLKAGIDRLKKREDEIESQADAGWKNFKLQTDTAVQNLKNSWNKGLEKLKVK